MLLSSQEHFEVLCWKVLKVGAHAMESKFERVLHSQYDEFKFVISMFMSS